MPASSASFALVFPGQGSQIVGMGRDLYDRSPAARTVFEDADEVLGWSVSKLCFEGPEVDLRDTARQQPAILTVSIAAFVALRERAALAGMRLATAFIAGHSVGQFAALVAAGAISFRDAIALVGRRGLLMREAGQGAQGGMAAILGMDEVAVAAVCEEVSKSAVACPANYNCPGQIVISGDKDGLAAASALALSRGARRVLPLAVTVANHSSLMSSAAAAFSPLVDLLPIRRSHVPIVANGSAKPVLEPEQIRAELHTHMTSAVRWTESVNFIVSSGVTNFLEVGPGQVLCGLVKRCSNVAKAFPAGTMDQILALDDNLAPACSDVV